MKFHVKMQVMLKKGVLDAQGQTVEHALHSLGYTGVSHLSMGKSIEMEVEGPDRTQVETQVREMGAKLLANPVVEDFVFELAGV